MLFCGRVSSAAHRVEVHGEQLAPVLQRAMDHLSRHAQIGLVQVVPAPVAGHASLQPVGRAQQQEAALRPGDGQRRVHHGYQHVVDRERALQRARQVQDGAQLGQVAAHSRHRPGLLRRAHLVHQAFQFRAVQGENELVGILRAEFDLVGIAQRAAA